MKWLIVVGRYVPEVGGGNIIYVERFIKELINSGHEVTLLTMTNKEDYPEYEKSHNLEIHRIYSPKGDVGPLWFKNRDLFTQKLISLLEKNDFDFVNTHAACLLTLKFLKEKNKYNFKLLSTFHAVHTYEILFNLKKYLTFNSPNYKELIAFIPKVLVMYIFEYYTLKYTDTVIVMSEYVKGTIKSFFGNKFLGKVLVTGIGVSQPLLPQVSKQKARETLNLQQNETIFITVRRLAPRMGLFNLIKAFGYIKDNSSRLLIIGKGELYQKLDAYIKKLNLQDRVHLLGYVEDDLLYYYYCAADCFILPTEQLEGFGIVTIEALNYNIPVIGTPRGATPEILIKFDKNLITKSYLPKDIAEKIYYYLERKEEYENINYKELVNIEYNWNSIIDKIIKNEEAKKAKTILFIPGFVCDTWSIIEQYSIELTKELSQNYNIIWLAPSIKNPYNIFKDKKNKYKLQEPVYATEAKKHNIKVITADLSKFNLIKNLIVLKKIFNNYKIDAVYMQFGFERYVGTISSKLLGKKVIYTEHSYPPKLKYPLIRHFLYKIFVDNFITISQASAEKLPKNKSIKVVPNAINVFDEKIIDEEKKKRDFYKEKLNLNKFDYIVLMTAAFRYMKRHDLAIKIAQEIINNSTKNVGFIFLGGGVLYDKYQKEIEQKRLSKKILMPGHVNNVNEYLAASDISILTSEFEGFGLCLVESMHYKLATLSFNRYSTKEIIDDGENGYLVEPGNIDEYADKILYLINNPQEIQRLGQNGYQKVKNNFDVDVWRKKMKKAFNEIMNDGEQNV
ncbi:MAG: glycosyltransferase [Candidatus Gastranaerophilales bacterium]|nr:glycosyltransferase [Candidatus Gastranaerophilales bacterium]